MSYVRFGTEGSDVYIYEDVDGYICCCWCNIDPEGRSFTAFTVGDMLDHIAAHREAGDHVPEWVDGSLEPIGDADG